MASALTAYLEAGEDAADEFRAAFVDAADRAFDAEAKTETKAERTKTDTGEKISSAGVRFEVDRPDSRDERVVAQFFVHLGRHRRRPRGRVADARGRREIREIREMREILAGILAFVVGVRLVLRVHEPVLEPWTTAEDAKSPGRAGMGSGGSPGKRLKKER